MSSAIFQFLYKKSFTPDGIPREGANVTKWGPGAKERYLEKYGPNKGQLSYRKKVAAKGKVVKKHSKIKDLPKRATDRSKGASLLTRRVSGATLS